MIRAAEEDYAAGVHGAELEKVEAGFIESDAFLDEEDGETVDGGDDKADEDEKGEEDDEKEDRGGDVEGTFH